MDPLQNAMRLCKTDQAAASSVASHWQVMLHHFFDASKDVGIVEMLLVDTTDIQLLSAQDTLTRLCSNIVVSSSPALLGCKTRAVILPPLTHPLSRPNE